MKALIQYSAVKNEKIPKETFLLWVDRFSEMGLTAEQITKAIRKTELMNTYGNTSFNHFTDALEKENQLFTHAELMKLSYERAERIAESTRILDERQRIAEEAANSEVKMTIADLQKFQDDLNFRTQYITEKVNQSIDNLGRRLTGWLIENKLHRLIPKLLNIIESERRL